MANAVLPKYSASAAFTITLASLASSTGGVGRQSTMVDNSSTRYDWILVYIAIKQGTSPTSAKGVYVSALRADAHATIFRTDGAGASDAAFTRLNAQLISVGKNKDSGAATGDVIYCPMGVIRDPGPAFGIAIDHDTGVNLDSTEGNHIYHWIGVYEEIQ